MSLSPDSTNPFLPITKSLYIIPFQALKLSMLIMPVKKPCIFSFLHSWRRCHFYSNQFVYLRMGNFYMKALVQAFSHSRQCWQCRLQLYLFLQCPVDHQIPPPLVLIWDQPSSPAVFKTAQFISSTIQFGFLLH